MPANAAANVLLPGASKANATESRQPLEAAEGISDLTETEAGLALVVGSGTYRFTVK